MDTVWEMMLMSWAPAVYMSEFGMLVRSSGEMLRMRRRALGFTVRPVVKD